MAVTAAVEQAPERLRTAIEVSPVPKPAERVYAGSRDA